ncbi:MAG TPA: MBL fold metallo-hydrolase [Candidatus Limnocylindria bacterium]|nr:MBL fold metallo-hydrolase [Candidatus Limnocylindria bacterium]
MPGSMPVVVPVDLALFGFLHSYLVLGERVVVVDAGYPSSPHRIMRALERRSIKRADVSLILLTHGHLDHLGGASALRAELGAPIALHRDDAEIARTGRDRPLHPSDLAGRLFLPFMPRSAAPFEPDIVHDGDLDLTDFGVAGRTLHTPGHTPGSISVVLDEATLAGDLVSGGFLRGRAPREPYFADDRAQLRSSLERLLSESGAPLYVGHRGPLSADAVARRFGIAVEPPLTAAGS